MSPWSNPCVVQPAPSCRDLLQIRALCFSLGHAGKPLPLDDLRHQGARPKPPQRQSVERAPVEVGASGRPRTGSFRVHVANK